MRERDAGPPARDLASGPWTDVYGLSRTLLALATLLTLLCDDVDVLFRPLGVEVADGVRDLPLLRYSLFSLLRGPQLEAARWVAILVLLAAAAGWRPRLTGVLHWYVTASFAVSCVIVEGGDQAAAILTLLLVPVTVTDPRRWHWSAPPPRTGRIGDRLADLVARSAFAAIRVQVAAIYFFACTAKLSVEEWANGTALYYWFLHPVFGVTGLRRAVLEPALSGPLTVTLMTWGVLAMEALLFMGLTMERARRRGLLVAGLLFHAGIALVHGLVSFAIVMDAALILYLVPLDRPLLADAPNRTGPLSVAAGALERARARLARIRQGRRAAARPAIAHRRVGS